MDEAKIQEAIAKAVEAGRVAGRAEGVAEATRERPGTVPEKKNENSDNKDFSLVRVVKSLTSRDRSLAKREWERSFDECKAWYEAKSSSFQNEPSLGFLVPPSFSSEIIGLPRSATVLDQMGVMRMSNLVGAPVVIPRQTAATTGYWVGELSNVTASDPTLDQISLTPHKMGATTELSNTLLNLNPGAAEAFLRQDHAAVLKRLAEKGFFEGTGTAVQPNGVKNIATNTVSFTSRTDVTIWQKLQQMMQALETDNIAMEGLSWVMHPTDFWTLAQIQLPQAANGGTPYQGMSIFSAGNVTAGVPRTLFGFPVYVTANITANTIYLVQPNQAIFADWGAVEIRATSEGQTLQRKDATEITSYQSVDVDLRVTDAVCTGTTFAGS